MDPDDVLRQRVKAELRQRMRGLRVQAPREACAARSANIVERLDALDAVRAARTIALFWPIEARHEVDLRALDARLRARGVRVAYPLADRETGTMGFRFVEHPETMPEDEDIRGFRQPGPGEPEAAPGDLDVIVVPALAVDPTGSRIGYGAGNYDRALPFHAPPAITIAVAYDYQLLAEIPVMPFDVAVHWIVTDTRALPASR